MQAAPAEVIAQPSVQVRGDLLFSGSAATTHAEGTVSGWELRAGWRGHPGGLSGGGGISTHVFRAQEPSQQQAVLGTAFLTLAVFVALYVLVYIECLGRRWLWASALLTWACLLTLGYVLVFDSCRKAACAWEQVTDWAGGRHADESSLPGGAGAGQVRGGRGGGGQRREWSVRLRGPCSGHYLLCGGRAMGSGQQAGAPWSRPGAWGGLVSAQRVNQLIGNEGSSWPL